MKVIKATNSLDDIEALKEVALEWRDTCNAKEFGIDLEPEVYFRDLTNLIEREDSDLLLLMKRDKVIGYMGLRYFQSPLGNQIICNENFWYVSCNHRGRGALLLLRAARKFAKEKGCSHLIMNASNLASEMHDRLCRFYERIGFKKFETSYIIKEI